MSQTREAIQKALLAAKSEKPNDRSELDRRYAVIITDLEKVMAYAKTFIDEGINI